MKNILKIFGIASIACVIALGLGACGQSKTTEETLFH